MNKYSVAIHPSEAIIEDIRQMKLQLSDALKEAKVSGKGWFHSKNSIAHITICEFEADEMMLEKVKKKLYSICESIQPLTILLNGFDHFHNTSKYAFFVNPDPASKTALKPVMRQFHNTLPVKTYHHSDVAHLSIARQLKPEEFKVAENLFTSYQKSFLCDGIVLRKFDDAVKQYQVVDRFEFQGKEPQIIQGTLF